MREIFTSGSVGGAPGNRCFYLEPDCSRGKAAHQAGDFGCYVVFTIIFKSTNVGGALMTKAIDKKKKGHWGRRAPFYLIKNFN